VPVSIISLLDITNVILNFKVRVIALIKWHCAVGQMHIVNHNTFKFCYEDHSKCRLMHN